MSNKKGKEFWGPPVWTMYHVLCVYFRVEVSSAHEEFQWLMTELLPCDYCKKNLKVKFQTHPPNKYLNSAQQAFLHSYIIHDLANQHITKYGDAKRPKISPPYDDVLLSYVEGAKQGPKFWGPPVWTTIHIFAATLRPENAMLYKRFLELLTVLLPDEASRGILKHLLLTYPIDPYLRNNHDAFFYTYMLRDLVNQRLRKGKSPPYDLVKSFYFSALGQECNDCKV